MPTMIATMPRNRTGMRVAMMAISGSEFVELVEGVAEVILEVLSDEANLSKENEGWNEF